MLHEATAVNLRIQASLDKSPMMKQPATATPTATASCTASTARRQKHGGLQGIQVQGISKLRGGMTNETTVGAHPSTIEKEGPHNDVALSDDGASWSWFCFSPHFFFAANGYRHGSQSLLVKMIGPQEYVPWACCAPIDIQRVHHVFKR
eukprot:6486510-Amphidinium_carterae.1